MNRNNNIVWFLLIMGFFMMTGTRWVGGFFSWVIFWIIAMAFINWINHRREENNKISEDAYDSIPRKNSALMYHDTRESDSGEYIETADGSRLEVIDDEGPDRLRMR